MYICILYINIEVMIRNTEYRGNIRTVDFNTEYRGNYRYDTETWLNLCIPSV